jgi:hypothetical protein
LYIVYKKWCGEDNEKVMTKNKLSSFMGSMQGVRVRKDAHYKVGVNDKKGTFVQTDKVPDDSTQGEYFTKCSAAFKKELDKQ